MSRLNTPQEHPETWAEEEPCDHVGDVVRGRCGRCGEVGLESDDEVYASENPR